MICAFAWNDKVFELVWFWLVNLVN